MFRVNQKVICIDDKMHNGFIWGGDDDIPKVGNVYTVLSVRDTPVGIVLDLQEIRRGETARSIWGPATGYGAFRFRPVVERKTDISALQALLVPGAKILEVVQ